MLKKAQKKEIVKKLQKKFRDNKLAVFCSFEGIAVDKQRKLKKEFKKNNGEMFVMKRRLLQKALSEEKINFPEITGSVMIGLMKDEIMPAKIAYTFFKSELISKKEKMDFIGGVLREGEGYNILHKTDLIEFAGLSSKEDLLAKAVGAIAAPVSNFLSVLQGNIKGLIYVLTKAKT